MDWPTTALIVGILACITAILVVGFLAVARIHEAQERTKQVTQRPRNLFEQPPR